MTFPDDDGGARRAQMAARARDAVGEKLGEILVDRRLTNQVRHRLCPGSPWDKDTATSVLRRDAACAA